VPTTAGKPSAAATVTFFSAGIIFPSLVKQPAEFGSFSSSSALAGATVAGGDSAGVMPPGAAPLGVRNDAPEGRIRLSRAAGRDVLPQHRMDEY
jgi:hypothetical protein